MKITGTQLKSYKHMEYKYILNGIHILKIGDK